MVLAQPVEAAAEMDRDLHDRTLADGLAEVGRRGVTGRDVTPFLLGWFHEHTGGASLAANVALVLANAVLAAQVAAELSAASRELVHRTGSASRRVAARSGLFWDPGLPRPGA